MDFSGVRFDRLDASNVQLEVSKCFTRIANLWRDASLPEAEVRAKAADELEMVAVLQALVTVVEPEKWNIGNGSCWHLQDVCRTERVGNTFQNVGTNSDFPMARASWMRQQGGFLASCADAVEQAIGELPEDTIIFPRKPGPLAYAAYWTREAKRRGLKPFVF